MSIWAVGLSVLGGAYAANRGASAAQDGADNAAATQMAMYNQTREDLAPYREVGGSALNAYARAMGLPQANLPQSGQGGVAGPPQGLAPIPGATWRGRPVFTDGQGGVYSGRGRNWTAEQGVSYLGPASENMRFDGTRIKAGPGILDYRDGNFYAGRGNRAGQIEVAMPEQQEFIGGSETNPEQDRYGGFEASPGYQFRMDEGLRATDRNAAARGRYMSGARERAVTRYGQGVASEEFGNYMNRLAGAAGIGQTATTQTGQFGQSAAANQGNAMIQSGNARASGYMGAANTIFNGINNYQAYSGTQAQPRQLSAVEQMYSGGRAFP